MPWSNPRKHRSTVELEPICAFPKTPTEHKGRETAVVISYHQFFYVRKSINLTKSSVTKSQDLPHFLEANPNKRHCLFPTCFVTYAFNRCLFKINKQTTLQTVESPGVNFTSFHATQTSKFISFFS